MTPAFASPPPITSRVPPEVWLRIFALATDFEVLLGRDSPISSDLPRTLVKQYELRRLKGSLHTKRSMLLVCKAWSEFALESLYQCILITKVDALVSLHESLQRHTPMAQGKSQLGWWAKRLDVLVENERCEASDYSMLAEVIRQLPNLSIATLSMPALPLNDCWLRQLPTSVIVSLAETCGVSLQVFDCCESILRPCRQRRLDDVACVISKFEDVPVMPKLESITLTSVFLRDYLPRDKNANHLPALHQLTYDCIPPPFLDCVWRNFVKITCTNLTSVTLDFCLPGDRLQNELSLLSECCTVLDRLVIYLRSWLELKQSLVLPPVSYLGLHSESSEGPLFHYQALVSALVTLTAPKLRTVRLLHANVAREMRENGSSFSVEDRAYMLSRSFSLEDFEGRVLFS